jgi:hypothetical protein
VSLQALTLPWVSHAHWSPAAQSCSTSVVKSGRRGAQWASVSIAMVSTATPPKTRIPGRVSGRRSRASSAAAEASTVWTSRCRHRFGDRHSEPIAVLAALLLQHPRWRPPVSGVDRPRVLLQLPGWPRLVLLSAMSVSSSSIRPAPVAAASPRLPPAPDTRRKAPPKRGATECWSGSRWHCDAVQTVTIKLCAGRDRTSSR